VGGCVEGVGELDVPVLVLAGEKDFSSTPEGTGRIAEKVGKRAWYVEVEGRTHMMVMEMAEAVAERLVEFRKGVDEEGL